MIRPAPTVLPPGPRCPHGMHWHLSCPACEQDARRVIQVRAANIVLDRRREGADIPALIVARALRCVGETTRFFPRTAQ